jgi:hypothetical protein
MQVQYRSFADLDADKSWWQQLPFVTDLFQVKELEEAFVKAFGSDGIRASDFARSILSTIPFLVPEEVDQEEAGSDVKKAAKSLGAEPSKLLPGNDSQQKGMQTTTTMTTAASVVTYSEEKLFDDGALGVGGDLDSGEGDLPWKMETSSSPGPSRGWFGLLQTKPEDSTTTTTTTGDRIQEPQGEREAHDKEEVGDDYMRNVMQGVTQALRFLGVDTSSDTAGGVPFLDQSSFDAGQEATQQLSLELQMKADEEYVLSGLAQPEEEAQDMNAASKNAVKEVSNLNPDPWYFLLHSDRIH